MTNSSIKDLDIEPESSYRLNLEFFKSFVASYDNLDHASLELFGGNKPSRLHHYASGLRRITKGKDAVEMFLNLLNTEFHIIKNESELPTLNDIAHRSNGFYFYFNNNNKDFEVFRKKQNNVSNLFIDIKNKTLLIDFLNNFQKKSWKHSEFDKKNELTTIISFVFSLKEFRENFKDTKPIFITDIIDPNPIKPPKDLSKIRVGLIYWPPLMDFDPHAKQIFPTGYYAKLWKYTSQKLADRIGKPVEYKFVFCHHGYTRQLLLEKEINIVLPVLRTSKSEGSIHNTKCITHWVPCALFGHRTLLQKKHFSIQTLRDQKTKVYSSKGGLGLEYARDIGLESEIVDSEVLDDVLEYIVERKLKNAICITDAVVCNHFLKSSNNTCTKNYCYITISQSFPVGIGVPTGKDLMSKDQKECLESCVREAQSEFQSELSQCFEETCKEFKDCIKWL